MIRAIFQHPCRATWYKDLSIGIMGIYIASGLIVYSVTLRVLSGLEAAALTGLAMPVLGVMGAAFGIETVRRRYRLDRPPRFLASLAVWQAHAWLDMAVNALVLAVPGAIALTVCLAWTAPDGWPDALGALFALRGEERILWAEIACTGLFYGAAITILKTAILAQPRPPQRLAPLIRLEKTGDNL